MDARFVLTFDFEMGWGAIENGLWRGREFRGVYESCYPVVKSLVGLLSELEIPATWAAVGGMLDPSVKEHIDHLPSPLREITSGALTEGRTDTFDGRRVAEVVANASRQRLACHGYTHVRFSYPGLTAESVDCELRLARSVLSDFQETVDGFVFPQNHEKFYAQLAAAGFRKVRGDEYGNKLPNRLERIYRQVVLPPPLSVATTIEGVLRVSGSLFFRATSRSRLKLLWAQSVRGIETAKREAGTFHVYIHPFNLAESPLLLERFHQLLRRVACERDEGRLAVDIF